MSCCVPGCVSLAHEWTIELPRDLGLQARWKAAIQAGTGQYLPDEFCRNGPALVCSMHFVVQLLPEGYDDEYREPSLFIRNNILQEVASCRLCLRYGTVGSMYDIGKCLTQGKTLQWMANKYFAVFPAANKEYPEKGYFCESCVVRIDMTHSFWQEISTSVKEYKKLLRNMKKKKEGKKQDIPEAYVDNQEGQTIENVHQGPCPTNGGNTFSVIVDGFESVVVKEEPRFVEAEPPEPDNEDMKPPQKISSCWIQPEPLLKEPEEPPGFKCHICNTIHERKEALVAHLMLDHDTKETFFCGECSFKSIAVFNSHLTKHNAKHPFRCSFCTMSFRRKLSKMYHETKQHGIDHGPKAIQRSKRSKEKECKQCGKKFWYTNHLKKHEMTHHGGAVFNKCEFCDKSLSSLRNLEQHMLLHRSEQPYKCKVCEISFSRKFDLRAHVKKKHRKCAVEQEPPTRTEVAVKLEPPVEPEPPPEPENPLAPNQWFACIICGEKFPKRILEYLHRQSHPEAEKESKLPNGKALATRSNGKIRCSLCPAVYKSVHSKNIVTHYKEVHPEIEIITYPCPECEEVFLRFSVLVSHSNIHSNTYACEHCGKRHYSNRGLTYHLHTAHGIRLDEDQYKKCPHCDRELFRGTAYNAHVRTHTEEKPFSCEQCGESFKLIVQLRAHHRIHIGLKPFECEGCGIGYPTNWLLTRHKKRCPSLQLKPGLTSAGADSSGDGMSNQ